ncbi:hypothetical protein [Psychrobacillus glaciei]|uniref:hypothetical protein n=1 Tax=Psychrobacillus glaciei TaxID=2283160 RepID=UPI00178C4A4B|nr:hypothetical protein [Psychrobacillus glaciei]
MKDKSLISYAIIFTLFASILFPSKTLADWAYAFVVWDGYVYVITDEIVNEVEKEIGHVTRYSDREGTYSGNFSNVYPKGTKYYSIVGFNTDEAIAIKDEKGKYIKAARDGEYARNIYDILQKSSSTIILWTLITLLIAILSIYFISKRRNENGK